MKKEIKTEILIQAIPAKVWAILTAFDDYPNWNPFITSVVGEVAVGNKIKINLQLSSGKAIIFKPEVLVFNKNQNLRWLGHLFFKGLLDGEHSFELIDNGNGATLFKQSETFSGILLPLFKQQLETNTQTAFVAMNRKLKEKVELNLKTD